MCGIAAIISPAQVPVHYIEKMTAIIRHRGPDDEGFAGFNQSGVTFVRGGNDTPTHIYESKANYLPSKALDNQEAECNVLLGHRRLSIIDLSAMGHQPMCDHTGRYWIVFNGEIYNYLELRNELKVAGSTFKTETDTEVILESYKAWGTSCQARFNGMWAFVIYDSLEHRIFLSRDRFGIKPLYYWISPEKQLLIASEIKQFTVHPSWKPVLHKKSAFDFLYYGLTDHVESTLFQGVFRLLPGHFYVGKWTEINWQPGDKIGQERWFDYRVKNFMGSFSEAIQQFRKHFFSAIRLHMRADVEVGTALSGGLDSSSIVCEVNNILREEGKEKLQKTFSSCSEDGRYDEKIWMDEVVQATGVDAHFVYPDGKDVFKITDKIIWHMDEPYQSQSAFLGFHVFELAKKNNVIVLLNGQGADEYLSGYTDFKNLRLMTLLRKGNLIGFFRETKDSSLKSTLKFVLANAVTMTGLRKLVQYFPASRSGNFLDKIVNKEKLGNDYSHPYTNFSYKKNTTKEISEHQLCSEPLQKYLRWEDRNSMAHSVEARVPFLDYRLVGFCRSLPLDYLDGPGESKKILTHALADILPPKIAGRKDKKGFVTPEERWFKQDFTDEFDVLFRENVPYAKGIIHQGNAEDYFFKLREGKIPFDNTYWRIILFCVWMKVFKVDVS